MSNATVQQIKDWLEFRKFTLKEFIAAKKITPDQIHIDNDKYKLDNLILIDEPEKLSAHVYFYPSGEFAIMNIYGEGLESLSVEELFSVYGEPETEERSRAGKTANYAVYAKEGFAFSYQHKDNEVHFLDLFPSMPVNEYIENIYLPPGPFIR
ncbi:MAG: hypothetical protein JWM14_1773 [Chitinophagaceae bacterium]|nr:hypothetical protein [Chitinophagaceae bacterium]